MLLLSYKIVLEELEKKIGNNFEEKIGKGIYIAVCKWQVKFVCGQKGES